jgi:hypothetical protein
MSTALTLRKAEFDAAAIIREQERSKAKLNG